MEIFILKIISIICATLLNITIVIARKDDIGIGSVVIAAIIEIIAICVIFGSGNGLLDFIERSIHIVNSIK